MITNHGSFPSPGERPKVKGGNIPVKMGMLPHAAAALGRHSGGNALRFDPGNPMK
jgi:hypothetical protein